MRRWYRKEQREMARHWEAHGAGMADRERLVLHLRIIAVNTQLDISPLYYLCFSRRILS